MFSDSDLPSDDLMFGHIDEINSSISFRSCLKQSVSMDSLDDIPMVLSEAEIFFQVHLRRA
jgi:hypothetical protein